MNRSGGATGWRKPDGLYRVPNGRYFYTVNGVMHLPVHTVAAGEVVGKRKPLILVKLDGSRLLVFMRAADVIAVWPQMAAKVKGLVSAFGFEL
jgi:hypothetical protein